jgi:hypothetical protein
VGRKRRGAERDLRDGEERRDACDHDCDSTHGLIVGVNAGSIQNVPVSLL